MKQKCALVTGASRGIGRETALAFAAAGYAVAAGYCAHEAEAFALVGEIAAKGGKAEAFRADVSQEAGVEAMFRAAVKEFGRLDVLVTAAGIAQQKLVTDVSIDEWRRMLDINAGGTFLCCREALKHMVPNQSGCIVTVSSVWGVSGASCEAHYSASKAAVIGLTQAIAKEAGLSGIRCNCIAPGVIRTGMTEDLGEDALKDLAERTALGRIGTPADIAGAAVFLASDAAAYITGQTLIIDGGLL